MGQQRTRPPLLTIQECTTFIPFPYLDEEVQEDIPGIRGELAYGRTELE